MSEIEIVWEAPPEPKSNQGRVYGAKLVEVQQRPGQWARLRTFTKASSAHNARSTINKRVKEDERWEVYAARIEDGVDVWGVWVRYRTPEQMNAKPRRGRPRKGAT